MTEPRTPVTHSGQTVLEVLRLLDELTGDPPVDWQHGIIAIEQEAGQQAASAERARLVEKLGLRAQAVHDSLHHRTSLGKCPMPICSDRRDLMAYLGEPA